MPTCYLSGCGLLRCRPRSSSRGERLHPSTRLAAKACPRPSESAKLDPSGNDDRGYRDSAIAPVCLTRRQRRVGRAGSRTAEACRPGKTAPSAAPRRPCVWPPGQCPTQSAPLPRRRHVREAKRFRESAAADSCAGHRGCNGGENQRARHDHAEVTAERPSWWRSSGAIARHAGDDIHYTANR